MANEHEMTDGELAEAIDRIPPDLVAESSLAIEQVERAHAQRQLEKIGIRVTREEAIRISREILNDAERGRVEVTEGEARPGGTDLEAFIEFFTEKGVPFSEWPTPGVEVFDDDDHELDGLGICDAILKFDDDGKFTGVFNFESGYYHERILAPEAQHAKG